jgi:hypothetical protein
MTERYMHLSPAMLDTAIPLFDVPRTAGSLGDVVETATGGGKTINKSGH